MNRFLGSAIALVLLFIAPKLWAQPFEKLHSDQYVHEEWTTANGLKIGHISQIYQTPDGYLWLASFSGLMRFDGVRFELFDASNTPGLSSNRILLIQPGQGNSFWLFTEQREVVYVNNGKYLPFGPFLGIEHQRVILDGDSLTWITSRDGLKKLQNDSLVPCSFGDLPSEVVSTVFRQKDGALIITDYSGNVFSAMYPYKKLTKILKIEAKKHPESFLEDSKGFVWLYNTNIRKISSKSSQMFPLENVKRDWSQLAPLFYNVKEDNQGNVWALTETGFYQVTSDELIEIQKNQVKGTESAVRQGAGMCACGDGSIWVVIGKKVYRNGKLELNLDEPGSTIFCDSEMSIWVTKKNNTLQRFSKSLLKYYLSGGEDNYYGVYQDTEENIWAGNWTGGVYKLIRGGKLEKQSWSSKLGITASFDQDNSGNFYIGTWIAEARAGENPNFDVVPGLPNEVFSIYVQNDSITYYGTLQGLYKFNGHKATQVSDGNNIADFPVRFILNSGDDILWLATNGSGVRTYNYKTGHNTYYNTSNGLSSDNVRALYKDEEGDIWVATEDLGLNKIVTETGEIIHVRKADGLYDDGLHNLILDDYNRLWMGTNQGLFWVEMSELQQFTKGIINKVNSTVYTERDGMANREANGGFQNTALKSSDGNLWFVTQKGIVEINPSKIDRALPPRRVIIEKLLANESALSSSNGSYTLTENQRDVTIRFTSPSFLSPNKIQFRYRLLGLSNNWNQIGDRREAVFTNLPSGDFAFEVEAYYLGNLESSETTFISIHREPSVKETWWFWIMISLIAAFLVYSVFKMRVHQLRRQKLILEKEVASRTFDLEVEKKITESQKEKLLTLDKEKSRFFANISHEFRTPLTLIQGPLRDLQDIKADDFDSPKVKNQILTGYKNTLRLMHLVEQLLDLSRLEAGKIKFDTQNLEINEYFRELCSSFSGLALSKNLDYKVDISEEVLSVNFDPEQLDKVFSNLLSNAFKFTPAGGAITIELKRDKENCRITISDNGNGIAAEHLPHLFDRFFQIEKSEMQPGSGIGLAIAKEITELHNGDIHVESRLGEGSTFTLRFPLAAVSGDQEITVRKRELAVSNADLFYENTGKRDYELAEEDTREDKPSLLIVDDNADIRTYVSSAFEDVYLIRQAISGNDAMNSIKDKLPDLVISDVMMPDGDGLELLKSIRTNPDYSFLPVILLTSKAEVNDRLEGLQVGADDYLTKPFDVKELRLRIRNILLARRRLQAIYASGERNPEKARIVADSIDVPSQDQEFLDKLGQIINKNFMDEAFTVLRLSEQMGQSRSNLYRKVLALTGETPSILLKRIRLEHGAQLIKQNAGSISEIAYACGFNSISHFSQSFSSVYGMSPTTYANN